MTHCCSCFCWTKKSCLPVLHTHTHTHSLPQWLMGCLSLFALLPQILDWICHQKGQRSMFVFCLFCFFFTASMQTNKWIKRITSLKRWGRVPVNCINSLGRKKKISFIWFWPLPPQPTSFLGRAPPTYPNTSAPASQIHVPHCSHVLMLGVCACVCVCHWSNSLPGGRSGRGYVKQHEPHAGGLLRTRPPTHSAWLTFQPNSTLQPTLQHKEERERGLFSRG